MDRVDGLMVELIGVKTGLFLKKAVLQIKSTHIHTGYEYVSKQLF